MAILIQADGKKMHYDCVQLRLLYRNSNLQDFEASITLVLGATGTFKSMDPAWANSFFGMYEADFSHINNISVIHI